MKLLYQTHSPYARKVLVFAHETGLADRIEVVHQETSPVARNDDVCALNPLGKVPVLIAGDGLVLFESSVICQYLDGLHDGPKIIPSSPALRYRALLQEALATGMADAGIAVRWESSRRPEALRWPALLEGQLLKIMAACDDLEHRMDSEPPLGIGAIALATTLSWIEFRRIHDFRALRPKLSAWYQRFCERPSMRATPLSGDTIDRPSVIDREASHAIAVD